MQNVHKWTRRPSAIVFHVPVCTLLFNGTVIVLWLAEKRSSQSSMTVYPHYCLHPLNFGRKGMLIWFYCLNFFMSQVFWQIFRGLQKSANLFFKLLNRRWGPDGIPSNPSRNMQYRSIVCVMRTKYYMQELWLDPRSPGLMTLNCQNMKYSGGIFIYFPLMTRRSI